MKPLTREFLLGRLECCGSRCTNCPYTPKHKKGVRAVDVVQRLGHIFPNLTFVYVEGDFPPDSINWYYFMSILNFYKLTVQEIKDTEDRSEELKKIFLNVELVFPSDTFCHDTELCKEVSIDWDDFARILKSNNLMVCEVKK